MEDIDTEQFKVCMIKKSKHYYKEVGFWAGLIVGSLIALIVGCTAIHYISDFFNIDNVWLLLIFAIYLIFMISITYAITNGVPNFFTSFIYNFVVLHGVAIIFIGSLVIVMICLAAIPIELTIISAKIIFNVTEDYNLTLIGLISTFIITAPINLAAFKCFKIEEYMDDCLKRSLCWFKIGDVNK